MLAMIQRNLILYFRNRSGVFFSLMGALISFIIYLVFLKESISSGWGTIPEKNQLLDTWLISGTLTITGMTTTLAALSLLVQDRENHVDQDLSLTDTSPLDQQLSYLISATLIGLIMQVILLVVMVGAFVIFDQIQIPFDQGGTVFMIAVINAFLSTLINYLLVRSLQSLDSLGKLSSLVGTAAGFLVGTYVPLGTLPHFAQLVMKLTPQTYLASLYRQTLMKKTIHHAFGNHWQVINNFTETLGVRIKWQTLLTQGQTWLLVSTVTVFLLAVVALPLLRQRHPYR